MSDILSLIQGVLERVDLDSAKLAETVEYRLRYPEEFVDAVLHHFRGGTTGAALDSDALRRKLDPLAGDTGITRRTWVNCIGNQVVEPLELITPRSPVDLLGVVNRARNAGVTVKAVGAGQSFSDILQTTGFFVDTTALDAELPLTPSLLRAGVDPATLVRVEAGMRLIRLNELLWDKGLALPNMPAFAGQAVAGAVATAAHGTGLALPPLSDSVVSVDLVAADGTLYRVEPSSGITDPAAFATAHPGWKLEQDDVWFRSVVVGIGCMGLVYAITLRVVPRYWLAETRLLSKWSEVRRDLEEGAVLRNRHWEVLVNPHPTDGDHTCLVTCRNVVPEPRSPSERRGCRQIIPALLAGSRNAEKALMWFLDKCPRLTPAFVDAAMLTLVDGDHGDPYVDRCYRVLDLGPINHALVYSGELAFPMTSYLDAVERIFEVAAQTVELGEVYQTGPFSLRFVAASEHYLAMSHGGPRCMIEMPLLHGTHGARAALARFDAMASRFEGRTHWGELQEVAGAVRALYPEAARWSSVRRAIDPDGMFDNTFTARTGL